MLGGITMGNKQKWILFTFLGFFIMIAPVLIYNAVNWEMFTNISTTKLSFSFILGATAVVLSVLTKLKKPTWVWLIVIGAIMIVLGNIGLQLGWSILMIGASLCLDTMLLKPLATKYKTAYLKEKGETVVYNKEV